jgi:Fe-S-cluster containining protein
MDADHISSHIERAAYRQRVEAFLACRDAASRLTHDSLENVISVQSLVRGASDVAAFADEAIGIVQSEYRPHLDCREGCSYCCQKPGVLVTIPEILRILDTVRATCDDDAMLELRQRANAYAGAIDGHDFNESTNASVPCPLLEDGRCTVYAVRPLVCRGYNSTRVDACRQASVDHSAGVPIFAMLKDVTDGATVGASQTLEAHGVNDALVDLGTALQIALSAGSDFPEAVASGSRVLSAAEHTTWVAEMWRLVSGAARRVGLEA